MGFKDKFFLIQSISRKALPNTFYSEALPSPDGRLELNEEGEQRYQFIQGFNFSWSESHFVDGMDAYIGKSSALDDKDSTSYEKLLAFVKRLGVMQRFFRGCRLLEKDGNHLVDKVLISVKDLIQCKTGEEIRAYLGS